MTTALYERLSSRGNATSPAGASARCESSSAGTPSARVPSRPPTPPTSDGHRAPGHAEHGAMRTPAADGLERRRSTRPR